MKAGCHIVTRTARQIGEKGPKTWMKFAFHSTFSPKAWRISFSVSEKLLTNQFTQPQRKCFLILKMLIKAYALQSNEQDEKFLGEDNFIEKFKISSFILKHTMFWTLEKVDQSEWRHNNLYQCINHVLDQLDLFLDDSSVPHYFLGPKKNLIAGDYSLNTREEGGH